MYEENCGVCRFWRRKHGADEEFGKCRRNAPSVAIIDPQKPGNENLGISRDLEALWPGTFEEEWCGEFQPKGEDRP